MADDGDTDAIEASGLLDGLEGRARAERAELIDWLLGEGFTVEQIRNDFAPMQMHAGRLMGDDGVHLSARQICEATGVDLELLEAMQRALGLPRVDDPDDPVHLRADAETAVRAQVFIDAGFTREQVIAVARVLGQGMAHTAEVMRQAVLEKVIEPGATELQTAKAYSSLVQKVSPLLGPLAEDVLRLQLRHGMETEAVNAAEREAGKLPGAREVAVCFADLVDFTRLGEGVPPEELESLANRLSGLARDLAAPPVHFVKTIGDAVMFVATDAAALLRAALELLAVADKEDLPPLRVGLAAGGAVQRAGDWFGSPVNLASRVTSVARPGTVLVAESVYNAIGEPDEFAWSFAGARHIKGIKGEVKLFRARAAVSE